MSRTKKKSLAVARRTALREDYSRALRARKRIWGEELGAHIWLFRACQNLATLRGEGRQDGEASKLRTRELPR